MKKQLNIAITHKGICKKCTCGKKELIESPKEEKQMINVYISDGKKGYHTTLQNVPNVGDLIWIEPQSEYPWNEGKANLQAKVTGVEYGNPMQKDSKEITIYYDLTEDSHESNKRNFKEWNKNQESIK